jgi:hypothetical protein
VIGTLPVQLYDGPLPEGTVHALLVLRGDPGVPSIVFVESWKLGPLAQVSGKNAGNFPDGALEDGGGGMAVTQLCVACRLVTQKTPGEGVSTSSTSIRQVQQASTP